jgi:hypothetical protein
LPDAVEQPLREPWQSPGRPGGGKLWPAARAVVLLRAAQGAAAEQSCVVPGEQAQGLDGRRLQPAAAQAWLQAWPQQLLDAPGHDSCVPRPLLPSSWPKWPWPRRRAWRYARNRTLAQSAGGRETLVNQHGPPTAIHAQSAREPFRPRGLQLNWSGFCRRPGRAPPIRQESVGS